MTHHDRRGRRDALATWGALLGVAAFGVSRDADAAPATTVEERRLQNRLELWHSYARGTEHLVCRYELRRESSLLTETKIVQGTLAFSAPDRLAFRDDGMSGAITEVLKDRVRIRPTPAPAESALWLPLATRPGMAWVVDRLVRLLAPGPPGSAIEGTRASAPRKRTPQLVLLPPADSPARLEVRSLTVAFDPLGGAIASLVLAEAQGDSTTIRLSDHRRDASSDELERLLPAP